MPSATLCVRFLVPTRWRGNALATRQRRVTHRTLARPESVPTPARGNQKNLENLMALTRRRVSERIGDAPASSEIFTLFSFESEFENLRIFRRRIVIKK